MFPDGACAGNCGSGSVRVQKGIFLNSGAQKVGEWTAGICPGPSADSGSDLTATEVNVWLLLEFGVWG